MLNETVKDPADAAPSTGGPSPSSTQSDPTLENFGKLKRRQVAIGEFVLWTMAGSLPLAYSITDAIRSERNLFYLPILLVPSVLLSMFIILIPIFTWQVFGLPPFSSIIFELIGGRVAHTFVNSNVEIRNGVADSKSEQDFSTNILNTQETSPRNLLSSFALESSDIATNIYRRAGLYLTAGAMIAFSGLGAFLYIRAVLTPSNPTSDIVQRLLDLVPGVGVLFFIEFVALFFLRQYRAAMNDFRYYDAVKRHRQESLVILHMFAEDKSVVVPAAEVIKAMSMYSTAGKLGKDETTEILETRRMERDEMILFEKIADRFIEIRAKGDGRTGKNPER